MYEETNRGSARCYTCGEEFTFLREFPEESYRAHKCIPPTPTRWSKRNTRILMLCRDLTVADMARAAGVSRQAVNTRLKTMGASDLAWFRDQLKVPVWWLTEDDLNRLA